MHLGCFLNRSSSLPPPSLELKEPLVFVSWPRIALHFTQESSLSLLKPLLFTLQSLQYSAQSDLPYLIHHFAHLLRLLSPLFNDIHSPPKRSQLPIFPSQSNPPHQTTHSLFPLLCQSSLSNFERVYLEMLSKHGDKVEWASFSDRLLTLDCFLRTAF